MTHDPCYMARGSAFLWRLVILDVVDKKKDHESTGGERRTRCPGGGGGSLCCRCRSCTQWMLQYATCLPFCAPEDLARDHPPDFFPCFFCVSSVTGEDDFSRSSMGSAGSSYIHYFIHVILSVFVPSSLFFFFFFFLLPPYLPTYFLVHLEVGLVLSGGNGSVRQFKQPPFFVYVFIRRYRLLRCQQLAFRSCRMLGPMWLSREESTECWISDVSGGMI